MVEVTTQGLRANSVPLPTIPDVAWAVAAGTGDVLTAAYTPANTQLSDGLIVGLRITSPNLTATPTFSPDSLTAHAITKSGGQPLVPGDLPAVGYEALLRYNLASTRWELLNPASGEGQSDAPWAVAGGTVNALVAAYNPVNVALYNGLLLGFRASGANTIAAPTFAPDSLAAFAITKNGGAPLLAGDIPAAGAECLIRFNLANTRWELLNPASDIGNSNWAAAAGTGDAITAAYTPVNLALTDGLLLTFRALAANTLAAPTFAPDSLTAHAITRIGGLPLAAGSLVAAGEYLVRYNLANTRWELLDPTISNVTLLFLNWGLDTGTATAFACAYNPAITALVDGLELKFRALNANSGTTPTFAPDAMTAHTIVKRFSTALAANDMVAGGEYTVRYNLPNTRWVLLNPVVN